MQNTAVLIDTNILLNYVTNREDAYLEQSVKIVEMCAKGEIQGYVAFHYSIIARFYDVRSGSIRIGEHDVQEFTCDSLFQNMSMVFQNVYLIFRYYSQPMSLTVNCNYFSFTESHISKWKLLS